jgi:hypothetical protein
MNAVEPSRSALLSLTLHLKIFMMIEYPDPIDPAKLDLVMRDHDHAVYYAEAVMKTPAGNEIADPDIRLLKHILAKLTIYGEIDIFNVNSFALFCYQRDYIAQGSDMLLSKYEEFISKDPLVKMIFDRRSTLLDAEKALTYLEDHPAVLNLVFWGMPEVGRRYKVFADELTEGGGIDLSEKDELTGLLKKSYDALMDAQRSAINLLSCVHGTGILLPMMLVEGRMTPSEYATAALAINLAYTMQETRPAARELFGKDIQAIVIDNDKPDLAYKELHMQAIRALEYISFFTGINADLEPSMRDLIGVGESYNLEFKSSFRWDIRQEKKNPAIEHASLKTICAFLNSSGGHLLIGVEDDGRVGGIEIDKFDNEDKFLLHFWNLVKASMGMEIAPYVRTTLNKVDGRTVCHVKCLRSPKPVFLNQKGFNEEFYIRTGPSSTSLEIREALQYISERFPSK